jgi:plasmid stabilization system protein ParE
MKAYQSYELHPEAYEDIDEIRSYIAADDADAADRVVIEIFNAIERLISFPDSGHRRNDLTNRPLRFIRVRDYLVAYAPDESPLWVIAIMHGHRSPRVMAAILRGREGHPDVIPSA